MNLKARYCLCAALLLLACLAAAGRGQYLEDSVDCGGRLVYSLAYDPLANVVYGASQEGPFFAISADSNKLVSSTWFDYPVRVAYDSVDNKAYCTVRTADYDTIMVMDGTTHQRIGEIPLEWATSPVWNPDNDRLYLTMGEMNKVAVIDCKADTIVTEIPVGSGGVGAVLNRRHQKLYVRNLDSDDVSIIDLVTNQVIKTVAVGNSPDAGYYCDSADKYYCSRGRGIVVIDGVSDSTLGLIPGQPQAGIAMVESPAHGVMMVATGDSILVVDTDRDSFVSRLGVGRQPQGLIWSPATDQVYCANWSSSVSVISGDGSRVVTTLRVGADPFCFALAPESHRVYLGDLSCRWVYVIRDTTSGIQEQSSYSPSAAVLGVRPNPFTRSVAIVWNTLTTGGHFARVYAQNGAIGQGSPGSGGRSLLGLGRAGRLRRGCAGRRVLHRGRGHRPRLGRQAEIGCGAPPDAQSVGLSHCGSLDRRHCRAVR